MAKAEDDPGSGARTKSGEEDRHYDDFLMPEPDLEDQFAVVKLRGEDEVDLDFSKEVDELINDVR
jgi:hypothetical protein